MRTLLLLILSILPLGAQVQITTNAEIQNDAIPPFRALLEANFLAEVDANEDGSITNPEALAWLSDQKIQRDLVEKYTVDALVRAESEDRATLRQDYQDALAALDAAITAVEAQREIDCPGCAFPPVIP